MWQKMKNLDFRTRRKHMLLVVAGLGLIGFLLVGCGATNTATMSTTTASGSVSDTGAQNQAPVTQAQSKASGQASSTGQASGTGQYGPQYLVKSLQVTMEVQNPLQSASELQQWVAFTDPQSTSDGSDYENTGNGQYAVTLTFLVDVAHYTQVEGYLRGYAGQKGRTLDSLKETVQDVTNDYVDTQSTLTNLRAEQQRLLGFMSQATNLTDAVNIEQQLTQVEGQINQIEAHLNELKGQTAFYSITVTVQPVGSAPPPPSPWSVVPIWQGAWTGVVAVWQVVVAILVWLLAFSIYIIPAGILIWLIRKRPWKKSTLPPLKPSVSWANLPRSAGPAPDREPITPALVAEPAVESSDVE